GASVSANIALEVIKTCLPHLLASAEGQERMRRMIPTFDHDLKQPGNAALFEKTTREATERLQLHSNT
ncbi:MAG: malate:quinone oxidoreductase, partial [Verrucomicrobiota bacterium]